MLKALPRKAEVAEIVRLSERKVLTLPIPKVRVGKGRGKVLYKEADVEEYLKSRTEYPVLKGEHSDNRVQKKPKKMGISLLPSRQVLEAIRLGTREEAKNAEAAHRNELVNNPLLRSDSLGNVAALYLIDSAERGRSKWRIEALRYNLDAFILPFFKPETPMTAITEVDVENFIKDQKRRGVKNSTIWHYVKDLRALFYWAMKHPERKRPFVRLNPVSGADLDSIQNRRVLKPPLNLKNFERAFEVLDQYQRAWWRTHECLGVRVDEVTGF